ncbi:MAG: phage terminase small subunit P27 family [Kiritimatiellia bacterium]
MGRKANPVGLHVIKKSHMSNAEIEARKIAEARLRPGSDRVSPPKWLSNEAKKEFRRIVKEFDTVNADLFTNVDVDMLAAYCDAYIEYQRCTEIIAHEGLMVEYTNKAGAENTVPHPLLAKKKQLFEQMKACASEFGLTPSARAKLTLPREPEKPKSKFERKFGNV